MQDNMFIDEIETVYESEDEEQLKHNTNINTFFIQKKITVEKMRKFNITDRDLMVLQEIYYGQMVPVWLIGELFFKGRESYKKKRLAAIRRHHFIGTAKYAAEDENGIKKTKGGLYYLTNTGVNMVETIQGCRERLTRVRIPEYTASDKMKYWQIAELRMIAYEYQKEWLYGKQVRESVYIKHNLQIDAQVDGLCVFVLKERTSRRGLIHLRTSISKLADTEQTDHLVICHPEDRLGVMQILSVQNEDGIQETVIKKNQNLWILSHDEGIQYLKKRFEGDKPHNALVSTMRKHGLEVVNIEDGTGVTPYIIKNGPEKYYLADFTNYNISELVRVMGYRSDLYKKYGGPDGVLMQVEDYAQLKEISILLRTTIEAQGNIMYMLTMPHNGRNMFAIKDRQIIARG